MAKYRQVHTTFWGDAFVLDLTPEEKYFYLYLMTNDRTTQCGIYELPKRVIEMHTGYNRETVEKLLERFEGYEKIEYNDKTKEIMMKNWAKYNFINSPKVKSCIVKELNEVKNKDFVKGYLKELKRFGYGIDTVSIDLGEEEEEEEEEEKEREEEKKPATTNRANAFSVYEQNFGMLKPLVIENISYWIDQLNEELVIESMKIAVKRNKTSFGYCEGILKSWMNNNVKTLADVQALALRNDGPKVNIGTHTKQNGGSANESNESNRQSHSGNNGSLNDLSL